MSRTVLITGANGFVGSNLADYLLARGDEVIGLDFVASEDASNLVNALGHSNFEYVRADIRRPEQLRPFANREIDLVYHLASVVGVRHYMEDPLSLIEVSVMGTRHIISLCQDTGARLVFTSTSEVYGRNTSIPWSEDDDRVLGSTSVDRWSYSTSKAVCEHMLFAMRRAGAFPFSIVRFFNVYGPRQAPIYVVSQSIHRMLHGDAPFVYDGGRQTRCFTFIDDAVEALDIIGAHDAALGEVFNVGNPVEHTIADTVKTILAIGAGETVTENVDTAQKYGKVYEDIDRRVPDVSKIRSLLGWEARVSLADGIRRTIEWAKHDRDWLEIAVNE